MSLASGRESNAKIAYDYEVGVNNINKTYEAKVGLIYLSEYYYGALPIHWTKPGHNSDAAKDYRSAANDNWICLGGGEWTISPSTDASGVFGLGGSGDVANFYMYGFLAVRPVFNLISSVELVGGSGTKSDPYRIL